MTPQRWSRIQDVFGAALETPEAERAAFLALACAGDEDVRREVESLLAQPSKDGPLDRPAWELAVPLAIGQQISHYRIQEKLGEGGMGVVYRAYDTQLRRPVALKVLPPEFASDPERRSRLLREARAASALHHPNIVIIHEVASDGGVDFIAMEFIEGKCLGDIIPARGLPLGKALDYAVQIAGGLAKAHAAGVVHRDLKPGNVMLTGPASGHPAILKLLDFGLARRVELAEGHDTTLTVQGEIVGTPAYMSPEQAQGKAVDAASDVFSFGSVLYQMVTGQQAFEKGSLISTLAAVVEQEPRPLPASVPRDLARVIGRCLRKDPARRFQHMDDVKVELEDLKAESDPRFQASAPPEPRRSWRKLWVAAIAAAVLLLLVAVLAWLAPKRHGIENYRYTPIEISRPVPSYPRACSGWAPDGRAFSYAAGVDGRLQVFVRYANSSVASQITHEALGALSAGWSPDSKRILVVGKNPQGDKPPEALFSLSVTGGEPEFVMPLDFVKASISQDGRVLTVMRKEEDGTYSVATSSPVGSPLRRYSPAPFETKRLVNAPNLKLSPDGSRILYFLNPGGQEQAWSIPFPAGSGISKLILKDLPPYGDTPMFSWFPDSRHIAISLQQHQGDASHLWIADTVTGSRTPLTRGLSDEHVVAVSPSGKEVLFTERTRDFKLVSASSADASIRTVISSQRPMGMPAWAGKVEKFAYQTDRTGEPEIWLHDLDGSERPLVTPAMFPAGTTNWWMNPALSPAGDRLAYTRVATGGEQAIWISSLAGGPPVRLTNTSGTEWMASWSPDGGRIAYYQLAKGGTHSIMICKTSGQALPIELRSRVSLYLPDWSPTVEWISFHDDSGWNLISPDGKSTRALGKIATPHLAFSKDGQTLYGIRAEKDHQYLFSLSLAGNRMKTIGDVGTEFAPLSYLTPGIRFSLSPDGKSILYPSYSIKTSLWMLEGFDAPY
jgi:serine/threonine protein kinase